MFKVEIVLDEEKILREGKIDLEEMWLDIDNQYTKYGLRRMSKGLYLDAGRDSDWGSFWAANLELFNNNPWFVKNVCSWLWYDTEEDDNTPEDILNGFLIAKRELVV